MKGGKNMPLEIHGKHLRVRVARPLKGKGVKYRTHDVGSPGHTKRIAMYNPRTKRWKTQSWLFPIADILARRPVTMRLLASLGVKRKAIELVRKHKEKRRGR